MKKSNVFFVLICFFLTYNVIAQPPPEKCKTCGKLKVNCPYKGSHPYLNVYSEEIRISGNEYSSLISVESNRKWDVVSNQPWILVKKTKNNFGDTFVDYTVRKNPNNTTREGYIEISTSDGTIKKRVKVIQLKDAGLDIKGVEFANFKDSLLSEYGDSLYAADIYFLSPRILYESLKTRWNSKDTFFIKVIKPNGVISYGDSSPSGYSYFTLLKNCYCTQQSLSGWGSSKGGSYAPGVYTYEIWFCENRIYSTQFNIYDKKENKVSKCVRKPEITFETFVYDFGQIKRGDNAKCEFVFRNTGQSDLILTDCTSSIGCTVLTWPKDPIPPGGEGTIVVKYNTQRVGRINRIITVESNASNDRVVLKIDGNVNVTP